jgi:hypothetical protein
MDVTIPGSSLATMPTYFRIQPSDEDPELLLDPANQKTEPWGDDSRARDGVSVFPDEDSLYRYMLRNDGDLEGSVLVELEGEESQDEDFDGDEGALLVHPRRVIQVRPLDRDRIRLLADAG